MKLCTEGCYRKKALSPSERRAIASLLVNEHDLPVERACKATKLSRTAWVSHAFRGDSEVTSVCIPVLNEH
jgi:hypothetical protein